MAELNYSPLDRFLIDFDRNVTRVLFGTAAASRPSPAEQVEASDLSAESRRHIAGLMRVNHAGEIAAQALYQGQALLARDPEIRNKMQHSSVEEIDHLCWCRQRIEELDGRCSYLDPFWYAGSLGLGMLAGLAGDQWSLGFIEETERQVVEHLQGHLEQLPQEDRKTRAILEQMQEDESEHGSRAADAGARMLPRAVRNLMKVCAGVMTRTSYHI
ncbi:MAG: 2-polyprenyl-3-methyl-6-methoxy-1,4-benzoquinone monooxygenase [Thiotrichales bacterium]|nr:2-polyprenyl-3-methyl-6-methoxy-1,4-benzoquinone monooxygenase [Thiotrichales bacterium]